MSLPTENNSRWAKADDAFNRGKEAYLDFCAALVVLRDEGVRHTEIAARYDMSRPSVTQAIACGADQRLVGITNLPKSEHAIYMLTTLDDEGFEQLAKPETTQAEIKAYKNAGKPPKSPKEPDDIEQLKAENTALKAEVADLKAENEVLKAENAALKAELAKPAKVPARAAKATPAKVPARAAKVPAKPAKPLTPAQKIAVLNEVYQETVAGENRPQFYEWVASLSEMEKGKPTAVQIEAMSDHEFGVMVASLRAQL